MIMKRGATAIARAVEDARTGVAESSQSILTFAFLSLHGGGEYLLVHVLFYILLRK